MGDLGVGLLGPVRALRAGSEVEVTGERTATLLALLALQPGRPVPVDRCIDELWPEAPPSNARNALQARVSQLRRVVGREAVRSSPGGYELDVEPGAVDVTRFEGLGRGGTTAGSDPARAVDLLGRALAMWHPEPLAGAGAGPVVEAERARLRELHLDLLEAHADARLAVGDDLGLVAELPSVIAEHPYREGLWATLALALYHCGRQADALDRLDQLRRTLREDLGLDPSPRLRQLEQRLLSQDPTLDGPATPSTGPRPPVGDVPSGGQPRRPRRPVGELFGRGAELELLDRLVQTEQVVTLTGPGGAGKTRLALEAAGRAADRFPGGAVLVELATVAHDDDVLEATAESAGLRADPQTATPVLDRLSARWRDEPPLVVLDNCEHVVAGAARLVRDVVEAGSGVVVLATSREPLGVAGEQQLPVETLAVPDTDEVDAVAACPAARLFLDRAHRVRPDLVLDATTAPHLAEICRRLDGIPLAIELAAARTKALSVADISRRLDDRFALLTTGPRTALPRQQTLASLIGWSYDLLFEDERRCFEELSVFVGDLTLERAEVHCAGAGLAPEQVLDLIDRLVDKSLLVADPRPGGTRYRMLETLRAFGIEQLAARGGLDDARARHAGVFAELARRADQDMRGPAMPSRLTVLDAAHDDLRAALEWAAEHDPDLAMGLVADLGLYWNVRTHRRDGRRSLPDVLASGAGDAPTRARALAWGAMVAETDLDFDRALAWAAEGVEVAATTGDPGVEGTAAVLAAIARLRHGEPTAVTELIERAEPLLERAGDEWGLAVVALVRGALALNAGRLDDARTGYGASLERFAAVGDPWGEARARLVVAVTASVAGDYESAADHLERGLELAQQLALTEQLDWGRHQLLAELGNVRMLQGDLAAAEAHHLEAIVQARRQGREDTIALSRNGLGLIARRQGDLERARTLHTESLEFWSRPGYHGGVAFTSCCLGFVAEEAGDLPTARRHHLAGLDAALAQHDPRAVALALEGLAGVAVAEGQADHGACLLGAAEALRARGGAPLPAAERRDVDRIAAAAAEAIGTEALAAARERGAELGQDEAVERARATPG